MNRGIPKENYDLDKLLRLSAQSNRVTWKEKATTNTCVFYIQFKLHTFTCHIWNWIAFPYILSFVWLYNTIKNPKKSLQKWTNLIYIGLCYMCVYILETSYTHLIKVIVGVRKALKKETPNLLISLRSWRQQDAKHAWRALFQVQEIWSKKYMNRNAVYHCMW